MRNAKKPSPLWKGRHVNNTAALGGVQVGMDTDGMGVLQARDARETAMLRCGSGMFRESPCVKGQQVALLGYGGTFRGQVLVGRSQA